MYRAFQVVEGKRGGVCVLKFSMCTGRNHPDGLSGGRKNEKENRCTRQGASAEIG